MDKIIYEYSNERLGNDTLLRYKLQLGYDWDDLVIMLKENHDGWQGNFKNEQKINITKTFKNEPEKCFNKIKNYIVECCENAEEYNTVLNDFQDKIVDEGINIKLIEIHSIYDQAKKIFNDNSLTWPEKYHKIFSDKISMKVKFEYYDPDTSYEEDVTAWMRGFDEYNIKHELKIDNEK